MAKWHTNLKRQKHFDKNNLSHNRVHFSLKILQKTSDFQIFMEACWTLDCRKGPETKIFHPGLVNLSSNFHKMAAFNWLPDFRSNAPSSFTYDLYGCIPPVAGHQSSNNVHWRSLFSIYIYIYVMGSGSISKPPSHLA